MTNHFNLSTSNISILQTVPTLIQYAWTAIFSLPLALTMALLQSDSVILSPLITKISVSDWLALTGISASGCLAFLLLVTALKHLPPILASSLASLEVVLSYTAQLILAERYPDSWAAAGLLLLIICLLITILHDSIVTMLTAREAAQYTQIEGTDVGQVAAIDYRVQGYQEYQSVTYTYIQ